MERVRSIQSRRWNNTTSILTIPANSSQVPASGAQTIMAGINPQGAGGGGTTAYIFSHCDATGANGIRFILTHNAAAPLLWFLADSTGSPIFPQRQVSTAANALAYGTYADVAVTWDGSLTAANIHIYLGRAGAVMAEATSYGITTNGTTAIKGPAGQPIVLGNFSAVSRAFNGDIFYVARWHRELDVTELQLAQKQGPLAVRDGLQMCWANDRDWGPCGINPSAITALSRGTSSAFCPRLYVGRSPSTGTAAAAAFQAAWARNANTVHTTGARPA